MRRSFEAMANSVLSPRPGSASVSPDHADIPPVLLTLDVGNVPCRDIRSVLNEPVHSLFEPWESLDISWLENQCRVKRHETNKRPDGQLLRVAEAPLNGVVVETVLFVPERQGVITARVGHRIRDEQEVLEELTDQWDAPARERLEHTLEAMSSYVGLCLASSRAMLNLMISTSLDGAQTCDSHVETEEGHPGSSIRLSESTASGQWFRSVEWTNVVETEESSFKDIVSIGILSVDPPGNVRHCCLA